MIDDNYFGDALGVDRLFVHCLSGFFEDFLFDEELNLLSGLNIFIKFGVPIDVIRLIVQYKHHVWLNPWYNINFIFGQRC